MSLIKLSLCISVLAVIIALSAVNPPVTDHYQELKQHFCERNSCDTATSFCNNKGFSYHDYVIVSFCYFNGQMVSLGFFEQVFIIKDLDAKTKLADKVDLKI